MLLAIILANTTVYLWGRADGLLMRPVEASGFDRVVNAFGALFVDNRAFPMFAFLFAYGIHQLVTREQARGASWPQARRLLLRRNAWLIAIGAAHAIFLFFGDVITTYALAGFALVLLVRAPKWVLWLVFGLSLTAFVPMSMIDAFSALGIAAPVDSAPASMTEPTLLTAFPNQLAMGAMTVISTPFSALTMLPPMMLGLLAARIRLLEAPWEHARLARTIAFGGIALAVLGGLPFAWAFLAGYEPGWGWAAAAAVHGLTGLAAGPAYVTAIALGVAGIERRRLEEPGTQPGPALGALSALGRRSMSGYVAQSIFCLALFPAWSLGLGGVLGTGWTAVVALGIWLATLIGAVVLERLDKPGPLEWLLRRLTYGPQLPAEGRVTAPA